MWTIVQPVDQRRLGHKENAKTDRSNRARCAEQRHHNQGTQGEGHGRKAVWGESAQATVWKKGAVDAQGRGT